MSNSRKPDELNCRALQASSAYSKPMPRARHRQAYCCLLALLLVVTRIAAAHAHFCYDGQEPPVSIRFADGGSQVCETSERCEPLRDTDVQIAADAVVKKPTVDDLWIVGIATYGFRCIASRCEKPVASKGENFLVEQRAHLRPPLRGPPV